LKLNLKIEELITKKSDDFEVSSSIKKDIKLYTDTLNLLFEKDQGKSFLVKHTRAIDTYIKVIFKYALRKHFGNYQPLINTIPMTLVALGSYAREQLCVYSDIDLMIVYEKVDGFNIEPIIETVLQIAWDSGLNLGHRVHLLEDLLPSSKSDHTIKTALLESRYIYGSKHLWVYIEQELNKIRNDAQEDFICSKIYEKKERIAKHGFNMEPDVKSSQGGLRDINTLYWIVNSKMGIRKIRDLVPQVISEKDYALLMKSVEFLYRIRVALHLSCSKKQDRLLFEYVPDVSKLLKLTQRRLLEKTFESMLNIELITDYFISTVSTYKSCKQDEAKVIRPNSNYDTTLDYLNAYLLLKDKSDTFSIDYIYSLSNAKKVKMEPQVIKELFYRDSIYKFFMALYKSKQLMHFFPILKKVSHLPQFDGYHKYPVDIHSVRTLLALENIDDENIKKIYKKFSQEEKAFVKIVTLFHDCGKGRAKNHSLLGAQMVKAYIRELGFSKEYEKIGYILVKYHTLMSNIASREDIYSEKVIFSFISKLTTVRVLEYLFVLTYADIESVAKGTYNNFNAKTLNDLYIISCEAFENKKRISEAQKRAKKENQLKKTFSFTELNRALKKKILSIESNLLYFKYEPNDIVNIGSWAYQLDDAYDYRISTEGVLVIELIRKENLNLGFLLGKLFDYNVTSMDIFKIFKGVKYFRVEFLNMVDEVDIVYIEKIILNSFNMDTKLELPDINVLRKEIDIKCTHSKSYARMSLTTKDSPALLANIMSVFDDIEIDIASAKIQTIKNRARNLFLIEKNGNFCNNQEEVIKRLTNKTIKKG